MRAWVWDGHSSDQIDYKRVGAAVVPWPCTDEVAGSIPGSAALCAFDSQSMLATAGFSPGTPAFLLHSKLI